MDSAFDIAEGSHEQVEIPLIPKPHYALTIRVIDESGEPVPGALISIDHPEFHFDAVTDPQGLWRDDALIENEWEIVVGKWSYKHRVQLRDHSDNGEIVITLLKGYQDDFVLNQDWQVYSEDTLVTFKRSDFAEFQQSFTNYPSADIEDDIGHYAYYTNNYEEIGKEYRLHGALALRSPAFDLSQMVEPELRYSAWAYGGDENATKEVWISTGSDSFLLESVPENLNGVFNDQSVFDLSSYRKICNPCSLIFHLYNPPDKANDAIALRAAFDAFIIEDLASTGTLSKSENDFKVYPNPNAGEILVDVGNREVQRIECFNLSGRLFSLSWDDLGLGIIRLTTENFPTITFLKVYSDSQVQFLKVVTLD